MKRPWTDADLEFVKARLPNQSIRSIASEMGRSARFVTIKLKRAGVRYNKEHWSAKEKRLFRENYPRLGSVATAALIGRSRLSIITQAFVLRVKTARSQGKPPRPTARTKALLREVAEALDCTAEQILGRERTPTLSKARSLVAIQLRIAGYSFPQIGRQFGRDHSTIIAWIYGKRRKNCGQPRNKPWTRAHGASPVRQTSLIPYTDKERMAA